VKRAAKKRARPQAAKKKPKIAKKRKPAAKRARPAKPSAKARPAKKRALAVKNVAKPTVDFERELKRERATRRRLEKRLTALVQELGQIRIYETRCGMLEEELRRRDEELASLRHASAPEPDPQAELPLGAT
jgi:hypothetical protein